MSRPLKITDPTDEVGVINRWADEVHRDITNLQTQVTESKNTAVAATATVADLAPAGTIPPAVTGISVSENGYIIDGVLYSELTCTYSAPGDISNFGGIYLVVKNYRGSSSLVKITEHEFTGVAGGSASLKVTLQRTNETITVYFVAKNIFGLALQDWALEPNTTITLDGNASAPAAPSGVTATQQALGVWLSWNENLETNMKAYNIYRFTSNTPSSAVKIGSAPTTGAGKVSFFDKTAVTGTTYYYWITAVNTALQESSKSTGITGTGQLVDLMSDVTANGSIPPSIGAQIPYTSTTNSITFSWAGLKIYKADQTQQSVTDGSQAITGLSASTPYYFYPRVNSAGVLSFVQASDLSIPTIVGVSPNGVSGYVTTANSLVRPASWSVEIWAKTTAVTNQPLIELNLTQVGASSTTFTAQLYINASGRAQAYSSATNLVAGTTAINNGNWHHLVFTYDGTNGTIYVDGAQQATAAMTAAASFTGYWRLLRGNPGGAGGDTFAASTTTISRAAVYPGTVLTATQIANRHADALISLSAYDSDVTTSSPTNYWKLQELSGSVTVVDSVGSNSGTYQGSVTLNLSSGIYGPTGSPAMAWLNPQPNGAQRQVQQTYYPWSGGAIQASTTSSGTGGGSVGGSGGGSDGCFTADTLVRCKRGVVPISEVTLEDYVLTAKNTWRRVVEVSQHEYVGDMLVIASGAITPGHRVLDGCWKPAKEIFTTTKPFNGTVWNLHVDTNDDPYSEDSEHSFTLESGLVVHNSIAPK